MKLVSAKPDLFDLLDAQEHKIMSVLKELTDSDGDLSTREGLEKSKMLFDSMLKYMSHQDELVNILKEKHEAQKAIRSYIDHKKKIEDTITQLTLMHVDEPDFFDKLKALIKQVKALVELEDTRLHRKLRVHLTESEIEHVRESILESLVRAPDKI